MKLKKIKGFKVHKNILEINLIVKSFKIIVKNY